MPNQLDELKKISSLATRELNVDQAKLCSATHVAINVKTILSHVHQPQFATRLQKAIDDSRNQRWDGNYVKSIRRNLILNIARDFNTHFHGQTSIELDADLVFDTEGLINQACEIHEQYRYGRANVEQLLINLPATWEGIAAARELKRKAINVHLTMIYSFIQAQAGADAEALLMSIPVGPISNWYQTYEPQDYSANDPGVATLSHIHTNLKCLGYKTLIRGSEFTHINQVQSLAGCDQLELTAQLAEQLQQQHSPLERKLDKATEIYERPPSMSERDFRWFLLMNTMAHEKLAQNIRDLDGDQYQLDCLIKEKIESM